jgi:hypothetical protein
VDDLENLYGITSVAPGQDDEEDGTMTKPTTLYCVEQPLHGGRGTWYAHFYPHPGLTASCVGKEARVLEAVVSEGEEQEGCYWAWWDSHGQRFMFVYPRRFLVEMCFPYGPRVEEQKDRGRLLPVDVRSVGEAGEEL